MRILITAIGSMSAECAIKCLRSEGHFIVGCDIYPGEWHYETGLCDMFLRAPFATDEEEYLKFLVNTSRKHNLECIIPLTDLEIDVINRHRQAFEDNNIVLCMQNANVLEIVRNKYILSSFFSKDENVPSVRTHLLTDIPTDFRYPCIAKPYNGRSSEGLIRNATVEQVKAIKNKNVYIVQEQLEGDIFTVDVCRSARTGVSCAIPRQELLRTKNGAGLTIRICDDGKLIELATYIGEKLDINGCVNMEFVLCDGKYYLIDINPRFSAGIAFSVMMGYNMIVNHLNVFCNKEVDRQIQLRQQIIIKKYEEVIINRQCPKNL